MYKFKIAKMQKLKIYLLKNGRQKIQSAAFENDIYKQIVFFLLIFSIEKINQKDMQVIFIIPYIHLHLHMQY